MQILSVSRLALLTAFAGAAWRYWLLIFPRICVERRRWQEHATRIPDPLLRELALASLRLERGNLEGAAAFAILVPRDRRAAVVRALVAFQAAYDYIDTLAEQSTDDPAENGRHLHQALRVALDPDTEHADYYAHHDRRHRHDGGYLKAIVDTCRAQLAILPSRAAVTAACERAADRMIDYQCLNHDPRDRGTLAAWAQALTPAGSGLRWWETAAGAASSLGVFALIAAAAHPSVAADEVAAIDAAYFPWIGALHVLLDSLVDQPDDAYAGTHSLVDHYDDPGQTAERLAYIAVQALRAAATLPNGRNHLLLLAAMTTFYFSAPAAALPHAEPASRRVLTVTRAITTPAMAVHRARRFGKTQARLRRRGSRNH